MHFEWDEDKAQRNAKKHRVSFEQAQEVFNDPRAIPFEDYNIQAMRKLGT